MKDTEMLVALNAKVGVIWILLAFANAGLRIWYAGMEAFPGVLLSTNWAVLIFFIGFGYWYRHVRDGGSRADADTETLLREQPREVLMGLLLLDGFMVAINGLQLVGQFRN